MKLKLYLSGSISGRSLEEAKKQFNEAHTTLEALGYEVYNPLELVNNIAHFHTLTKDEQWTKAMREDIKVLKDCNILINLPHKGIESKGAEIEEMVAMKYGIPIIHYETLEKCKFNLNKALTKDEQETLIIR